MTAIPGVRVTGKIVPTDTTDVYAVTDPIYGIDGWRGVADAAERNAITTERRREGMIAYQEDADQIWQLNAAPWVGTDADWTLRSFGGAPAGSDGEMQFNSAGSFGADPDLFYDVLAPKTLHAPALTIDVGGFSANVLNAVGIAVNTNNLNSLGQNYLRINCTVNSDLTGITTAGFSATTLPLFLFNSGTATLTLKNQDPASSAANRFLFGADLALGPDSGCLLVYDNVTVRWRLLGKSANGGTEVRKVKTVVFADSPYTLLATDCQVNVDCSGGNVDIAVPTAVSVASGGLDRVYHLKRVDNTPANSLTVSRSAAETFMLIPPATTSFTLSPGDSYELAGDSANSRWMVQ
jgi:hypothetical protein